MPSATEPNMPGPGENDGGVVEALGKTLGNQEISLPVRFRALFTLKSLNSAESVDAIASVLRSTEASALLKHELAYVLGQMRNPLACHHLSIVLENESEDTMVRHEAAEALGAIGNPSSRPILQRFASSDNRVIRETCELALDLLAHDEVTKTDKKYASVDPAPPASPDLSIETLKTQLLDSSSSLFKRYRAMFALRDKGSIEAVLALAEGFIDESALFRHEIAYVFGQLQHPGSVPSLIQVLSNNSEEPMVRHEAAEALGSIASPDCLPVLEKFSKDSEPVVKESCLVGLDMYAHEHSGELQYADGITKNKERL